MKDAVTIGCMYFSISILMIGSLASVVCHIDGGAIAASPVLAKSRPSVAICSRADACCRNLS
jgi:hypothetical protein